MPEAAPSRYVMGHSDRERRRLAIQGLILNPFTEQLMRRAGITGGMRVLDIGCGIGDLSMMASRLVGRHGQVTALDMNEESLGAAQERIREQGLTNVSFVNSTIDEYQADDTFDAVVGRHILIHVPNPLSVVQNAFRILREGGVAVFQEFDFSVIQTAYPPCPLREQVLRLCKEFFCRATQGDAGTRLFHLFVEAGFTAPDCRVEYPIDGGLDSPFYEWIAESVRSFFPRAEALGMVQGLDIHLDTLAERLREEAVAVRACCPAPLMVGGFARKR
jgi:ubiquinone/menaquinone biosynthesis C-methylase UbiE